MSPHQADSLQGGLSKRGEQPGIGTPAHTGRTSPRDSQGPGGRLLPWLHKSHIMPFQQAGEVGGACGAGFKSRLSHSFSSGNPLELSGTCVYQGDATSKSQGERAKGGGTFQVNFLGDVFYRCMAPLCTQAFPSHSHRQLLCPPCAWHILHGLEAAKI